MVTGGAQGIGRAIAERLLQSGAAVALWDRDRPLVEATRVIDALPSDIQARVRYLSAYTVDTISLRLRNGRVVRWGSAEDTDTKARVLTVLLEQPASLYDVSVPGQPVIRR